MLKKYDELTDHQKSLVALMYSDKSTVHMYLYNFEGDKYRGRQYNPEGMNIHNEPVGEEPNKKPDFNLDNEHDKKSDAEIDKEHSRPIRKSKKK